MREGACCSRQQPLLSYTRKYFIYAGSENRTLAVDLVSTVIIGEASKTSFLSLAGEYEMTEKKKTWIKGWLAGVVCSGLLLGIGYFICFGTIPLIEKSKISITDIGKINKIASLVEKYYLEETEEETLADGMYSGMLLSLQDRYSGYYSKEMYQQLKEATEGAYTGVGLTMAKDQESGIVTVVALNKGGPAEQAGIQMGDILTAVDGESVAEKELSQISQMIREENKKEVVLTMEREGAVMEIKVPLEKVEVTVVYSRMLEDHLGYIQIAEFTDGTSSQFQEAYEELQQEGMEGLMIDLRENPGGLLNSVCDTLEQILPEGMIVYTEDKNGKRKEHTCKGESPIEIPLVVVVNENSASAAEIFCGAVKDHGVGTLVGTTTFGKGIVQQTFPLGDGSAVKLTTSKYYTPNGANIHGTGIMPDVETAWPEDQEAMIDPSQFQELSQEDWENQDIQMKTAREILQEKVETLK